MTAAEDQAAEEFAVAYLAVMGRPLAGDTGSYLPGPAEIEGDYPEPVTASEDAYRQRLVDDRIGEMYGFEPGAKRQIA